MVIRSSSVREVDRLVGLLRDGSPVERESAIARLRVIGARAIERLARLIAAKPSAAAHAAALRALEGMDDPRARELAVQSLNADTPAVAAAGVAVLRARLSEDAAALDTVTALALDKTKPEAVRLAALDALSDLPRATIQPLLQHVGADLVLTPAAATARDTFDQPAGIREWLGLRGAQAPLSEIHDAIARIRDCEREEPSARRRQEWQLVRAAAHLALARRGSRVALYDLRETFDTAERPVPLDFLTAATLIADATCLEPLAKSWAAAAREPWWRQRIVQAAHEIAARLKLTGRHAAMKRVRAKYPGFLG